jgi:uncharacterized membrane protein
LTPKFIVEGHTTLKTRCRLTVINLPNQTSKRVTDTRDETLDSQHFSHRHGERYTRLGTSGTYLGWLAWNHQRLGTFYIYL